MEPYRSVLRLHSPNPKVLQAIPKLGSRVTVADVAARTGLAIHVVTRELNKIAADTQAVLEVSKQGTIAYSFARDLDGAYRAKGTQKLIADTLQSVRNAIFYCVRLSFGLLLIASILTLVCIFAVALVMILFVGDASDGDLGDVDLDADLSFNFFDVINLSMFFTWWRFDLQSEQNFDYFGRKVDIREKGFLFNCFSFLFGDGDPNAGFEEQSWQYVGELIRRCNGVLTAEQVAPYLVACGNDKSIFPVLVRFDGAPEVTDNGNIVYVFPAMQTSAQGHFGIDLPAYAEAKQWKFSEVPLKRLDFVFYFAGANLAGWYAMWTNLHHFKFLSEHEPLVKIGLCYAVFFLAFPILRQFVNAVRNAYVDVANSARLKNYQQLLTAALQEKMREAQYFMHRLVTLSASQVVYTTEKDSLEQITDEEFFGQNVAPKSVQPL